MRSAGERRARWRTAVRSWHFPVLAVVGAGIIAACGGGSSKGNDPNPAVALQLAVAPPSTFADREVLSPAPEVQLVDANGDAVSGAGVTITATLSGGTGTLNGTVNVATDASGKATFSDLSIAGGVGAKSITFIAAGLTAATANGLTMTAGPASVVTALSATSQAALTSTAVSALPSVSVTDQDANPIAGATVTFAVTAGGGTATGTAATTNAGGVATVGSWTTGGSAGANTMTATVAALTPVTFTVNAAPAGVAVKLAITTQPQATVAARATLSPSPVLQLQDAVGGAVNTAGVAVTVALTGAGTLNGTTSVNTNAAGQATFSNLNIAGTVGGNRSLAFASTGLTGASSTNIALTAGAATNIASNSATTQSGTTGAAVATLPSVKVTDADGNAVQGTSVIFNLTGGGGTIGGATQTSSASGIATLGSWTLGAAAGANTVTAAGNGISLTGAPVTFTVNATAPTSLFNITLQNIGPAISPTRQAAFDNAKARWQQAITGDLADLTVPAGFNTGVNCGNAPVAGTIDDVLILFTLDSIDGPSNILGAAGPCFTRTTGSLTVIGIMRFDTADVAGLENNGSLNDVILHEMGHVLGYGTLWNTFGVLAGACTATPTYTGTNALAAYTGSNGGGAATSVPVENFQPGACNNGTRDSHWEEDVFRSEVMTGFISGTVRPLSLTSIRQFQDLGYQVNPAAADAFNIGTQPTLRAGEDVGPNIPLGQDVLNIPLYSIDNAGNIRMIRDKRQ